MTDKELQDMVERAVSRALERHTPLLVERAAERVEQRFFANVGQRVVTHVVKWIGAIVVAGAVWLYGAGVFK